MPANDVNKAKNAIGMVKDKNRLTSCITRGWVGVKNVWFGCSFRFFVLLWVAIAPKGRQVSQPGASGAPPPVGQ